MTAPVRADRAALAAESARRRRAGEAAFRARVAELGGQVVGQYVNCDTPIDCICPAGHPCRPRPSNVRYGRIECRTCGGNDQSAAGRGFEARIVELGGQVIGQYVGANTPVDCICPAGHPCAPRPTNVRSGQGMCRDCTGRAWDTFYVTINPTTDRVKFGVASGGPATRLRRHRQHGYTTVVRVLANLSDADALERRILSALRDAGVPPVEGREYFDASALAVILDIADGWVS